MNILELIRKCESFDAPTFEDGYDFVLSISDELEAVYKLLDELNSTELTEVRAIMEKYEVIL